MSKLVDSSKIEHIVGISRHKTIHYAKAVSSEKVVYILHSQDCVDYLTDLRECPFSESLDKGIDADFWKTYLDEPVELEIDEEFGDLIPYHLT